MLRKSKLSDVFPWIGRFLILLLAFPFPALAAPTGGSVTKGSATVTQKGSVTDINQASQKVAINWKGFSIASHETVNFKQPSTNAIALNRVIGNEKSVIEGALNANGKVFLINSNGVFFGKGASVNVGGLVASTLDITDNDFLADNFVFRGQPGGQVVNMGTLKAADGGYIALLGERVQNEGVILAERGVVSLNGAQKVSLNFNGDSLIDVSLDEGSLNALVETKNAIIADGGRVILTAKAADALVDSQVNTGGLIAARTLNGLSGDIEVYAHGGVANIAGTLDASAPSGGDGGFIETSGVKVKIADDAVITTKASQGASGTWLIDPDYITITSGGGVNSGATVSANLNNGNVVLQADIDIIINDIIAWNSANSLTLKAGRDININNAINVNGNGALYLLPGRDYNIRTKASYSGTVIDPATGYPVAKQTPSGVIYGSINFTGSGGSLYIGGADSDHLYTLIGSLNDLQNINGLKRNYALARDLDLSSEGAFSGAVVANLKEGSIFTGLGHTISNLAISATSDNVGLFGASEINTIIRDIGLINPNISSNNTYVGSLIGNNKSSIHNSYVDGGIISGYQYVGGLVGGIIGTNNVVSTITDSFSTASVKGAVWVGGLVGFWHMGSLSDPELGAIARSHATGAVTNINTPPAGTSYIGGLIGNVVNSSIRDSYATGAVFSTKSGAGGLIGILSGKKNIIENCFATGAVESSTTNSATMGTGGLIGSITSTSTSNHFVSKSYATGAVTGLDSVGGLVGDANASTTGTIIFSDVYATGNVLGSYQKTGGLIGYLYGSRATATILVKNAYATGNVVSDYIGAFGVGGLIGQINYGTILNSYATGSVTGLTYVGGLVGVLHYSSVTGSYATGTATGPSKVGGLVGKLFDSTIRDSYATGLAVLTPDAFIGALAGGLVASAEGNGGVFNSYWNAANEVGYNINTMNGGYSDTEVTGSRSLNAAQLSDQGLTEAIISGADPQTVINERIETAARLEAEAQAAAEALAQAEAEALAQAEAEAMARFQAEESIKQESSSSASNTVGSQATNAVNLGASPTISLANFESKSVAMDASDNDVAAYASVEAALIDLALYNESVNDVISDGVFYSFGQGIMTGPIGAKSGGLTQTSGQGGSDGSSGTVSGGLSQTPAQSSNSDNSVEEES
ncbi:MAG: filamentous hemagglutinin N-terminal domain-containing protein [Deltaproteobacteria bacterium]|jgi:filamentous hemagglutinin family protein|nr:filamentous hemagglutinin N-terminal domain-containing protein [Deltaproteobacteria bacterium]